MLYEKKVKYLDYFEGGKRVRGGGFVKLEARGGTLRVELSVTGLHHTDTFVRDVMLCGRGREEACGKVEVSAGRGQYRQLWQNLDNIGGTGIGYGELSGFRIPLGAGREISCRWQEDRGTARHKPQEAREPAAAETARDDTFVSAQIGPAALDRDEMRTGDEPVRNVSRETGELQGSSAEETADGGEGMQKETGDMRDNMKRIGRAADGCWEFGGESREEGGEPAAERTARSDRTKAAPVTWISHDARQEAISAETAKANRDDRRERGPVEWERRDRGMATVEREGDDTRQGRTSAQASAKAMKLMEEKWQQLWAIYPHIRPFQDAREYLSISPADFVLFPEDSYKAVNNSFLLHGYYNYHHLLLARVERKGEACYYIGVPGNFYEKEKQVAIMFGFESFECAEEPAQAGDFGYYMMRARI